MPAHFKRSKQAWRRLVARPEGRELTAGRQRQHFRFASMDSTVTVMSQLFPPHSKYLLIFADALNKENERNVRFRDTLVSARVG